MCLSPGVRLRQSSRRADAPTITGKLADISLKYQLLRLSTLLADPAGSRFPFSFSCSFFALFDARKPQAAR
jgi:hypothetical protein